MSRSCPNCGTNCAADARFCRLCGIQLKAAVTQGAPVSPRAKTVPLSEEGKTTRGLSPEDGGAGTRKVGRAEMESLLRRPSTPPAPPLETDNAPSFTDEEAFAAPATSALPASVNGSAANEDESSSNNRTSTEISAESAQEESAAAVATTVSVKRDAKSPTKTKTNPSARRMWQAAALALLLVAVGAAVLAFYYSRRASTRDAANSSQPISISDQQRLVEENLTEAENLLAAGKVTEAIARLRYIIKLDPSNARAHRMLAEALERTGNVNEAIDEYRAATDSDPRNEETWLRYADALRRVGRMDEAREIYQKLSTSQSADVARTAKEQLAGLPPAVSSPSSNEQSREARTAQRSRAEENESLSSNQSQPATSANSNNSRAKQPKNDPVASYNMAMKIIEGKNIKKMKRAELIYAYQLFQYALSGPNAADAKRHIGELDKVLWR